MFTARRRSISSRVSVNTLPYLPNPNLYSWDFTARNLNGSTILRVPEMARGAANACPAQRCGWRLLCLQYADFRHETFIDQTDTTAYPIRQRPAMTIAKGIWYTIEQQHDFVTPANNRAWLNGVEVAANIITAFAATAYPLTDSAGAVTGNNFEGILNALGVYDGVPTPAVRQSFSGWINSVRPI